MNAYDERLVIEFERAARFLIDKCENWGWKKFSSNYLREHVRCVTGLKFSNSKSPEILRALLQEHPELSEWIELGQLKEAA